MNDVWTKHWRWREVDLDNEIIPLLHRNLLDLFYFNLSYKKIKIKIKSFWLKHKNS